MGFIEAVGVTFIFLKHHLACCMEIRLAKARVLAGRLVWMLLQGPGGGCSLK